MGVYYEYNSKSATDENKNVKVVMPLDFRYVENGEDIYNNTEPLPSLCQVIIDRDMDNQFSTLNTIASARGEFIGKKFTTVFSFVDTDDFFGFCDQINDAKNLVKIALEKIHERK